MNETERNRVITRAVAMSLGGIILVYAAYQVRDVLLMLYVSSLLAIGLSPIVRRIERTRGQSKRVRLPRWLAILSIYVVFLLAVALVLALTLPPLIDQFRQLAENMPTYMNRMLAFLSDRGIIRRTNWTALLPNLQASGGALVGNVFGAVQGVIGVFGAMLTVLILPFYLLLESKSIHSMFLRLISSENRARADAISSAVTIKVGAWLGGQLLLAAIIGASATIGYWLIGVPYFYVLGLIAAVGEMIPVVGPIIAAVPAIALGWTVSPQTALIVLAYSWAQQFVENNLLVPRIMERQLGVSPVTVIVALLIGSALLGLVGAILAVPTAAILQVLFQELVVKDSDDR
jgi:predicted PurR-regulated permease PerM